MWTRQILTTVVVVVIMATAALAALPRTKDPRYPDYIVDPKVKCVEEGSFHHPRNCSWYYRCVDRMNMGFFFTYYFECEPGTVFSDDLDQCVHPHSVGAPCGTGTTGGQTRPPIPPIPFTTQRPITPTIPTEITTLAPVRCIFPEANCLTYEYCQPRRETKTLCSYGCYINTILVLMKDLCQSSDMLYDNVNDKCIPKPSAAELCPATTPAPNPIVTENNSYTLRCTDQDTRPKEDWIISFYCKGYNLCNAVGQFQKTLVLCDNFYQCRRTQTGSWTSDLMNCINGLKYSYDEDACVSEPTESEQC